MNREDPNLQKQQKNPDSSAQTLNASTCSPRHPAARQQEVVRHRLHYQDPLLRLLAGLGLIRALQKEQIQYVGQCEPLRLLCTAHRHGSSRASGALLSFPLFCEVTMQSESAFDRNVMSDQPAHSTAQTSRLRIQSLHEGYVIDRCL